MPDFTGATHAFHHTLDSALSTLSKLNIAAPRVTVSMDGRGYPTRWVIAQEPEPGTPLEAGVVIRLRVAGTGMFNALPVGMWDKGGETEPGTYEILAAFDDPFKKAAYWVREGARLFDIQPDNPAACERWIALFGIDADNWPKELWYPLAILLPSLHSRAGSEDGLRAALWLLLALPLRQIRRSPAYSFMDFDELTRLGANFSRLGLDAAVGNRSGDAAGLTLVFGPVQLSTYYRFQTETNGALLDSVIALAFPLDRQYFKDWLVLDPEKPPRLGVEAENARLGINSHLGSAVPLRNEF